MLLLLLFRKEPGYTDIMTTDYYFQYQLKVGRSEVV